MMRFIERWIRRLAREEMAAKQKEDHEVMRKAMKESVPRIVAAVNESLKRTLGQSK
jgi:hypothetical protein